MEKTRKSEAALPLAKLIKLFQLIAILKAGRWTILQLVERFDSSKSSMYRYLEMLEQVGFYVEKDFHNRYFIVTSDDDPLQASFTAEEMKVMRAIFQADATHPIKSSILKKLPFHTEQDAMPRLFLKVHLGHLVEQLTHALRNQHQVILKNYFSANSGEVRDRVVEPFRFGDNYGSIRALDVEDKISKTFKLDRIGEIVETRNKFEYEDMHEQHTCDMFGLSGDRITWVTLHLSVRAYLLIREEFPLSLPYLKNENSIYTFYGPVARYNGIGRFVLGLIDEIKIEGPEEFKEYVRGKREMV